MFDHEIITSLQAIVSEAEEMKDAYFFPPISHASCRRSYEKRHTHPEITWQESGHTYSAEYIVKCSCNNVYAQGIYYRDGKRTTLTAIRNSLKRMIEEEA